MATERDRTDAPVRAADALAELLSGPMAHGLSEASRAARAWYAANGNRERAHTTGVWLRKSGRSGVDPVLVVALDSQLLAGELGMNKDLYLQRLALHGVAVSDVRFTVGKTTRSTQGHGSPSFRTHAARGDVAGEKDAFGSPSALPELSEAEEERVADATQGLPDGLKQSVSRAMCASLRRHKATGA